MTRIVSAAALLVVLTTALAGCGDEDADPRASGSEGPPLTLTASGGCGDAYFWATTSDDEHAVVVSVDLGERSASEPTVRELELPDPDVEVELWQGSGLRSLMCNDLVAGEVTEETPVVEGRLTITLQPRPEKPGNLTDGKAELRGLVAEDGTTIADLDIKTTSIGFYAG